MYKLLFLITLTLFFLNLQAHKPVLGEEKIIDGKSYDVFYYSPDGKPQYLKQRYDRIAVPATGFYKNLPSFPATIYEIQKNVAVYQLDTPLKSRKEWVKLKTKIEKQGVPVWPVVDYYGGDSYILNGNLSVVFKKSVKNKERIDALEGFEIIVNDPSDPDYYLVKLSLGSDPFKIANELYESGIVRWAQPDWFMRLYPAAEKVEPDDMWYNLQTWWHNYVRNPEAWAIQQGSPDITVAVIDNGVDTGHQDMVMNMRGSDGYDFVDMDNYATHKQLQPTAAYAVKKIAAHGTCVAGIIGAKGNNSIGVAGTCWNCKILPIRLIDFDDMSGTPPKDTSSSIYHAFKWAVDKGADVINNSWVPMDFSNPGCAQVPFNNHIEWGLQYAIENGRDGKGSIVVFAAGNDSCPTSNIPNFKNDHMLIVSAIRTNGYKAVYSNYGSEIDIIAPGGSSGDPTPENGLMTTDISFAEGYDENHYLSAEKFIGTSAAAPVVSGAVALMLSEAPQMTFQEALHCVKKAANANREMRIADGKLTECKIVDPQTRELLAEYEWETVTDAYFETELQHNNCFGYGLLDTYEMVRMARDGECAYELPKCTSDDDCEDGMVCDLETGLCVLSNDPVDIPDNQEVPDAGQTPDTSTAPDNSIQPDANNEKFDTNEAQDIVNQSDNNEIPDNTTGVVNDDSNSELYMEDDTGCGCSLIF